jgi:hypothetical protein
VQLEVDGPRASISVQERRRSAWSSSASSSAAIIGSTMEMIKPRQSVWESEPERVWRGTECRIGYHMAAGWDQGSGKRKARVAAGGREHARGARFVAAAHLVEGGMGKDEDLVRHGDHVDVLREEDDERAAEERVDEPIALKQLGHRVPA